MPACLPISTATQPEFLGLLMQPNSRKFGFYAHSFTQQLPTKCWHMVFRPASVQGALVASAPPGEEQRTLGEEGHLAQTWRSGKASRGSSF